MSKGVMSSYTSIEPLCSNDGTLEALHMALHTQKDNIEEVKFYWGSDSAALIAQFPNKGDVPYTIQKVEFGTYSILIPSSQEGVKDGESYKHYATLKNQKGTVRSTRDIDTRSWSTPLTCQVPATSAPTAEKTVSKTPPSTAEKTLAPTTVSSSPPLRNVFWRIHHLKLTKMDAAVIAFSFASGLLSALTLLLCIYTCIACCKRPRHRTASEEYGPITPYEDDDEFIVPRRETKTVGELERERAKKEAATPRQHMRRVLNSIIDVRRDSNKQRDFEEIIV